MDSKPARFPSLVYPAGVRETRALPLSGPRVHPAPPSLLLYAGNHDASWSARVVRATLAQALSNRFRVVVVGDFASTGASSLPPAIKAVRIPTRGAAPAERERQRVLARTCRALQPTVIVIEQYPFGDLHLGAEVKAMLDAAATNVRAPLVVSSVRQLPDSDPVTRADVCAARSAIEAHLDAILVHTDPNIARLADDRFHGEARWSVPVRYTGFISVDPRGPADVPAEALAEGGEIVVFGEGGGAGDQLCHIAVQAATHLAAADRLPMRIIAGQSMPDAEFDMLQKAAAGVAGVVVDRDVDDMRHVLSRAAVTISHGACPPLDVVRSRVPALVVPSAGAGDISTVRARRLAALGAVRLVEPDWLDAPTLACQIAATIGFAPQSVDVDLSGAHSTVRFLAALADAANRFSAPEYAPGAKLTPIDHWTTTRLRRT
jgi:predicted glycosyltransferase